MNQATNQLVAAAKRFAAPAAAVGAFALGAALFVGHGNVHAASAIDDNSVSALTSLDRAMEAVASRVTPAVVNVAVTSRSHGE
jgi:serine protease Do